jgi:hypothetical protein
MPAPSGIQTGRKGFWGLVDKVLASNLERLVAIPGSRRYKHFVHAAKNAEATQLAVLFKILNFAQSSVFGKEHGFAQIASYEEYKEQVPMMDYEALRPYIERHLKGEADVLFPGKPLMYNCSSGTTSKPKLIPVTPYNFETTIKGRSKLWLYGIMRDYPGIYSGKSLGVVSPAEEGVTEDGTPFGSLSGLVRKNLPPFINLTHSSPYNVALISDYAARTYAVCRFALPSDISIIITGNPATVLNIAVKTDQFKEDLLRDINDGTLKKDLPIEPAIRAELEGVIRPAAERARELEAIITTSGKLLPSDYWPNLKLIHTWTNGNTGLVVPKLKAWFKEETPVLDFGYVSSEILSTDLMVPGDGGSVLALESGFFEFVRYEDEDKSDKQYLMAHELLAGEKYFIYVTTYSGLYRYDMNDVIEVIGFFQQAPIIKFLFKGKGIANMQGEKLSEAQFIEAVGMARTETGVQYDFFIGYADLEQSRYQLFVEFINNPTAAEQAAFGTALDEALCTVNVEYASKFKSERIRPTEIIPMGREFFTRFRQQRIAEGAYEGQIKWMHLSTIPEMRDKLVSLKEST